MSNKVGKMIAIFSAVSVISACFMGWLNSDSSLEGEESEPYQGDDTGALVPQEEQRLLDDNGNGYTLFSNPYGSETASFDNGEQVTFSRDEDGNKILTKTIRATRTDYIIVPEDYDGLLLYVYVGEWTSTEPPERKKVTVPVTLLDTQPFDDEENLDDYVFFGISRSK